MTDRPGDPAPARMPEGRAGVSEEDTTAYSTPAHNLVGALLFGVLGALALVLSLQMPNPDSRAVTAPGLLPALVGISLMAMSLFLGYRACRHGARAQLRAAFARTRGAAPLDRELARTIGLMGIVGGYVFLLDFIFFDWTVEVLGTRLTWGSFELFSTAVLALILALFWRGRVINCVLIGLIFSTVLAAVFRYVFVIPVPGSG